ncbi:MAG: hypothetical protein RR540_07970, partial [Oscillospiraceae bacterium]
YEILHAVGIRRASTLEKSTALRQKSHQAFTLVNPAALGRRNVPPAVENGNPSTERRPPIIPFFTK